MEVGAILKARIVHIYGAQEYNNVQVELSHGVYGMLHYDDSQRLKAGDTLTVRIIDLLLRSPEQRSFVSVKLV